LFAHKTQEAPQLASWVLCCEDFRELVGRQSRPANSGFILDSFLNRTALSEKL
jgi:hypothetical protein